MSLIKHQGPDVDKIYLYVKDLSKSKYQLLIDRGEKVGIENLKNPKAFIIYKKLMMFMIIQKTMNPTKKRRVLVVFDDMIADMESNKKLSPIVTELFLRGRKIDIFISQSYFKMPKTIRLNTIHYFIMKIPNKKDLQQIVSKKNLSNFIKKILKNHIHFCGRYNFVIK